MLLSVCLFTGYYAIIHIYRYDGGKSLSRRSRKLTASGDVERTEKVYFFAVEIRACDRPISTVTSIIRGTV